MVYADPSLLPSKVWCQQFTTTVTWSQSASATTAAATTTCVPDPPSGLMCYGKIRRASDLGTLVHRITSNMILLVTNDPVEIDAYGVPLVATELDASTGQVEFVVHGFYAGRISGNLDKPGGTYVATFAAGWDIPDGHYMSDCFIHIPDSYDGPE